MNKHMLFMGTVLLMTLSIAVASNDGPPVGTRLDTNADGVWDYTYLGNGEWDPPMTSMPPPGTLIDMNNDNAADAILVDQNGNGIVDGIDVGMDGTVDGEITENGGGGGGGGGGNGEGNDGPPVGTRLDTNADGVWDYTYLGNGEWDPPMTSMPPPGTLIDMNNDNAADAILVDQNGNGIVDGIDVGMDGTVDGEITENGGGGGGGGGGNGEGNDGGPQVGTKLDTNADGVWDYTYLGNGEWDPPMTSMPPPGTLIDSNGDDIADAILVDQNGNGIVDGVDVGMDGTVDMEITEGDSGGGNELPRDSQGMPIGMKLDTNADGVWDYTYLGEGVWDPPMNEATPPGTLVDYNGDNVADAVIVDQNGNGIADGIDNGMDGTVDSTFPESSDDGEELPRDSQGMPIGMKLDTNADGIWDHTYLGEGVWDPPMNEAMPPGTLVDYNGDNVADAVIVDQNGNGIADGIDNGMDGTVDSTFPESSADGDGS